MAADPSSWVAGDGVRGRLGGGVVFFARSPRMRDLSYLQCREMLGERAQEKTTTPPTLEKETIGVNPQRAAGKALVGWAQLGDH
jgi:hypothetical protein